MTSRYSIRVERRDPDVERRVGDLRLIEPPLVD
jgi:hypothetical protein